MGKGRGGRGEVLEYKAGAYLAALHLIGGNGKATESGKLSRERIPTALVYSQPNLLVVNVGLFS